MMWKLEKSGEVLALVPTRRFRAKAAVRRALVVGGVISMLSAMFFLASFLGPNPEPLTIQLLSGLALGLFFGGLAGIVMFLRRDIWVFDTLDQTLVWQSKLASSVKSVSFPLADLKEVHHDETRVTLVWKNGQTEMLVDTEKPEAAKELVRQIREYVW